MDSLYNHTIEDSFNDLSEAGCIVSLSITGYGEKAKYKAKIKKGESTYGTGFEISVEGEGVDGAAAVRGAVATAETFIHTVPGRPTPKLPDFRTAADPLRQTKRAEKADVAEALDAHAERELEPHL